MWHRRDARGDHYKFVSMAAVRDALKCGPIDTGWLTPGVVRAGSTAKGDFAVLIIPAGRHTIPVERAKGAGIEDLTLNLPTFAFIGHGKSYHVYALKSPADAGRALTFRAPLPNVFDSGRICWGSNTPPSCSVGTIAQAWALFMAAPFNGHAASNKVKGEKGDVRAFLRKVARSRGKFPADKLVPFLNHDNTLDAAVTAVLGGRDDS